MEKPEEILIGGKKFPVEQVWDFLACGYEDYEKYRQQLPGPPSDDKLFGFSKDDFELLKNQDCLRLIEYIEEPLIVDGRKTTRLVDDILECQSKRFRIMAINEGIRGIVFAFKPTKPRRNNDTW